MANPDCVLIYSGVIAYIVLNGCYYTPQELRKEAQRLQQAAIEAQQAGALKEAVKLYRDLLPLVRMLGNIGNLPLDSVQAQLAERAVELAEQRYAESNVQA